MGPPSQRVKIMNVLGHGIDIVDVSKIQRWIEDPRELLVSRCFTPEELDEIGDGINHSERLAGRFAAKEAVLKAIGTGFGAGVAFTDVVILRTPGAPPRVKLTGGAEQAAVELGVSVCQVSISHAGGIAMASAIALGSVSQYDGY